MTPDKQALAGLLERVGEATGSDRELDLAILLACGCTQEQMLPFEIILWPEGSRIWMDFGKDRIRVTASLDAALSLCERALPGWAVEVVRFGHDIGARADVWPEGLRPDGTPMMCRAKTPALALLAAMLKSLIAGTQP